MSLKYVNWSEFGGKVPDPSSPDSRYPLLCLTHLHYSGNKLAVVFKSSTQFH